MATSGQWSGQWLGGWQGALSESGSGALVAAGLQVCGYGSLSATARLCISSGIVVAGHSAAQFAPRARLRAGLVGVGVGAFRGSAGESALVDPSTTPTPAAPGWQGWPFCIPHPHRKRNRRAREADLLLMNHL